MNSIVKIFASSLIIVLLSCSRDRNIEIPPEVIPEDKMIEVLTDIHIVEGARMGRNMMGDTLKVDTYFHKIYQKHQVSREKFDSSFSFYSTYPGTMDKIYEKVIENLNAIELSAPEWEDENKNDSLSMDTTDTSSRQNPFQRAKSRR